MAHHGRARRRGAFGALARWRRCLGILTSAVAVAALAVAAIPNAAAANEGVPRWPDNPDWQSYVMGNDASTANPVAVASTAGDVTNPRALVTGSGTTTLTNTPGQAPPTVVLDYGKEVGGLPFFNVSSVTPMASATSVTMRAGYSELQQYVLTTSNVSTTLPIAAPAGATNVPVNSVTNFFVGRPVTIDTGANAESATITAVGTPSVSSSLFTGASAGDTNVKLTSVTGLGVDSPLTIDPGPNQEQVTATSVGTAGVASTVAAQNVTSGLTVPPLTGTPTANWLWNTTGAATSTPAGTIYLRKTFEVVDPSAVTSAVLRVNADDGHTTYVNGVQVSSSSGANNAWQTSQLSDIKSLLVRGTNVIAIAPFNSGSGGGVIATAQIDTATDSMRIVSDGSWKALPGTPATPPAGWNTAGFDDSSWPAATVTGAYGISPWNNNVQTPPGPTTLRVASVAGFAVGDPITIDSGTNQEMRTITAIGTAGATGSGLTMDSPLTIVHSAGAAVLDTAKPGTGVTFTPALTSAHEGLSPVVSLGTGISFTPALSSAHPAGATVSTTATTVAGDANGNNGVGTDGSRADNFALTSASGGTTVGNAVTAVQGGERFQAITLTTPGTVVLSGLGIAIKHYNQGAGSYQGYFMSSDDTLNKIWYDGVYTTQTDSIVPGGVCSSPTTCSQSSTILDGAKRDRRPWSGDLTVEGRTIFDSLGFGPGGSDIIKNTIGQFGSSPQSNGSICGQISNWINYPTSGVSCSFYSPTYSMYWSIGLVQYYLYSGDLGFAEAQYQRLQNELAYDRGAWDPTTGLTRASGSDWDFYDGRKGGTDSTGGAVTATNMLYYADLSGAAWMAHELALQDPSNPTAPTWTSDAATWSTQADALKTAINSQLFNSNTGVYQLSSSSNGTHAATAVPQDGNSQAITFGVAPSDKVSGILSYLKNNLWGTYGPQPYSADANYATTISPFVSGYELDARFMNGDTASALALTRLLWAQMVDQNGPYYTGTLWERLGQNGQIESSNASLAHGWASAPVSAFSSYLLGVRPVGPGYKTWTIRPQPGDLAWSEGQMPTPNGPISVKWAQDTNTGQFHMQVVSPSGTGGEIWVPLASPTTSVSLPLTSGATFVQRSGNYDVYRVGAGTFEFSSAPVTFSSLEQLVAFFSTDPSVTSGLNDKLAAAAVSKSTSARDNQLTAFVNQVNAQTGKALTPDQAQVLITLAAALR